MLRMDEIADASLAARREARRLGMAMAAMMPMIATTISSSTREKPPWVFTFGGGIEVVSAVVVRVESEGPPAGEKVPCALTGRPSETPLPRICFRATGQVSGVTTNRVPVRA